MNVLLSLDSVARRTDQPTRRLREWCATGQLRCEREGRAWVVPESELDRIHQLAIGRDRSRHLEGATALAVPIAKASSDLDALVARRLKIADDAVSLTPMAIDGQDYVVAVWHQRTTMPASGLLELAEELDAELLRT